jgi:hypothetical protein
MKIIWDRLKKDTEPLPIFKDLHEMTGDIVGNLLIEVMKTSTDNLTAVIISLNGLKSFFDNSNIINNTANTVQQVSKHQKSIIINVAKGKEDVEKQPLFNKFNKSNTSNNKLFLVKPKIDKENSIHNSNINNSHTNNESTVTFTPKVIDFLYNPVIERGNLTQIREKRKVILKSKINMTNANESIKNSDNNK